MAGSIETYIRQAALARGIDPNTAVRVARSEGGLKNPTQQSYVVKNGRRETSFGPFQLRIGGGLGDFALRAGIDPRNEADWQKGVDFALNYAAKHGWGSWYGAANVGVSNFAGISKNSRAVAVGGGPVPPLNVGETAQGRQMPLGMGRHQIGSGPEVKQLQQHLADAGFSPGKIDGVYGPKTAAAVRSFEKSKGLTVDKGVAGPQVLTALNAPPAYAPGGSVPPQGFPTAWGPQPPQMGPESAGGGTDPLYGRKVPTSTIGPPTIPGSPPPMGPGISPAPTVEPLSPGVAEMIAGMPDQGRGGYTPANLPPAYTPVPPAPDNATRPYETRHNMMAWPGAGQPLAMPPSSAPVASNPLSPENIGNALLGPVNKKTTLSDFLFGPVGSDPAAATAPPAPTTYDKIPPAVSDPNRFTPNDITPWAPGFGQEPEQQQGYYTPPSGGLGGMPQYAGPSDGRFSTITRGEAQRMLAATLGQGPINAMAKAGSRYLDLQTGIDTGMPPSQQQAVFGQDSPMGITLKPPASSGFFDEMPAHGVPIKRTPRDAPAWTPWGPGFGQQSSAGGFPQVASAGNAHIPGPNVIPPVRQPSLDYRSAYGAGFGVVPQDDHQETWRQGLAAAGQAGKWLDDPYAFPPSYHMDGGMRNYDYYKNPSFLPARFSDPKNGTWDQRMYDFFGDSAIDPMSKMAFAGNGVPGADQIVRQPPETGPGESWYRYGGQRDLIGPPESGAKAFPYKLDDQNAPAVDPNNADRYPPTLAFAGGSSDNYLRGGDGFGGAVDAFFNASPDLAAAAAAPTVGPADAFGPSGGPSMISAPPSSAPYMYGNDGAAPGGPMAGVAPSYFHPDLTVSPAGNPADRTNKAVQAIQQATQGGGSSGGAGRGGSPISPTSYGGSPGSYAYTGTSPWGSATYNAPWGQTGYSNSSYTPSGPGWQSPNFDSVSGGPTYAYRSNGDGTGTYVDSQGNWHSY